MKIELKSNKFYKTVLKRFKNLKWLEIFGIAVFFCTLLFAFFLFTRKTEDITVVVRLLNSNNAITLINLPRQIFSENIKAGIKQKGEFGNTIAEVLDVYKYPSPDINQDIYVTMKINSYYNKQTGQYSYDNLPLLIGDYRTFRLENVTFNGLIIDINASKIPRQQKEFLVTGFLDPINNTNIVTEQQVGITDMTGMNGVKNYLADQLQGNMKIVDSNGQTGAEIVSVNKTAGKISSVQNGRYITVEDPSAKHVELTLSLLADKIGDNYYFQKEQSLSIGNSIFLSFDNVKVVLTITSVKEIDD